MTRVTNVELHASRIEVCHVPDNLHKAIKAFAEKDGRSINKIISDKLRKTLLELPAGCMIPAGKKKEKVTLHNFNKTAELEHYVTNHIGISIQDYIKITMRQIVEEGHKKSPTKNSQAITHL